MKLNGNEVDKVVRFSSPLKREYLGTFRKLLYYNYILQKNSDEMVEDIKHRIKEKGNIRYFV